MAKHASTEFSRLNLVIYAMGFYGIDIHRPAVMLESLLRF